jgi:hypothetical protein
MPHSDPSCIEKAQFWNNNDINDISFLELITVIIVVL